MGAKGARARAHSRKQGPGVASALQVFQADIRRCETGRGFEALVRRKSEGYALSRDQNYQRKQIRAAHCNQFAQKRTERVSSGAQSD